MNTLYPTNLVVADVYMFTYQNYKPSWLTEVDGMRFNSNIVLIFVQLLLTK